MADYTVVLSRRAAKQLDKLEDDTADVLLDAIAGLSKDPRPYGYRKLVFRQAYRIRVGDYRIIYEIYDSIFVVDVIDLGHRKDIYK